MKVNEIYSVKPIDSAQCKEWVLKKHYAKRMPSISYAFGLFNNNGILSGICTFAKPMSWSLQIGICGEEYADIVIELNRLVVNQKEKNLTSFFVGKCLRLLPSPCIVVSYADSAQNHHGYIYQATNFIYTGLSKPFKEYAVKGMEKMHSASIGDKVGRSDKIGYGKSKFKLLQDKFGAENVYWRERSLKHRYIFFKGNKYQKKTMLSKLKYKILPYPKGDNKRYDASYNPTVQTQLF